jgi:transposase
MIRKIQAIILLEEKASIATIEGLSGYKREVAVKFRRKYVKGGLEALRSKRKKKAAKSLLTHNQREEIVTILNEQKPSEFGYSQPFWTTTILANLIKEQWGLSTNRRVLCICFLGKRNLPLESLRNAQNVEMKK